jgi:tetratricopeptide (TPR) repeat protein
LPDSLYLPDKEPSQSALDLFQKGVDSFNRQKFKEAYDLFNRAIQSSGGAYSRALVYRGRTEQSLGRNAEAVSSFRRAVELKPTDFETKTLLADAILRAGGDIKPAYDSLRDVIRDYPTYAFAHVVLGDYLLGRGEIVRAERVLRRAVALGPKSPPAHLILADALTYQAITEKQMEAVAEAERALNLFELLSTKRVTFKGLSVSHLIFGGGRYANDPALAEAHYVLAKALTRAVDGDPGLTDRIAFLDRARVSIQQGMKLAQGLGDKVRIAQLLVISASNFMLKGDIQGATRDGEQALKLVSPLPHPELKAQVHFALYQAYERNQKCAKAA